MSETNLLYDLFDKDQFGVLLKRKGVPRLELQSMQAGAPYNYTGVLIYPLLSSPSYGDWRFHWLSQRTCMTANNVMIKMSNISVLKSHGGKQRKNEIIDL